MFEIRLSNATGGAVLGSYLIAQVTIAKSDSPSGKVMFLNDSEVVISNPDVTQTITLSLERVGGLVGNATVSVPGAAVVVYISDTFIKKCQGYSTSYSYGFELRFCIVIRLVFVRLVNLPAGFNIREC